MEPFITAVAISLASYHFNEKDYNQINPGVFVETKHKVVLGVYRNSYYRTTTLAGYQFGFGNLGPVRAGAIVGACTGYKAPVCATFTFSGDWYTVTWVPPLGKDRGNVLGFALRVPFGVSHE